MKALRVPIALWVSAVAGLLLMLLHDGGLELLGLFLLAVPLALVGWYVLTARARVVTELPPRRRDS